MNLHREVVRLGGKQQDNTEVYNALAPSANEVPGASADKRQCTTVLKGVQRSQSINNFYLGLPRYKKKVQS